MISKIHHPGYEPITRFGTGFRLSPHVMTERYVETIGKDDFPKQNQKRVGKEIYIQFRRSINGAGYDEYGTFVIARCDLETPNVAILLGTKSMNGAVIVTDPKHVEEYGDAKDPSGHRLTNPHIHIIPIQDNIMIGSRCQDEYFDSEDPEENIGYIVRKDITCVDPQIVIYEPYKHRFILQDEARIMVQITPFKITKMDDKLKEEVERIKANADH